MKNRSMTANLQITRVIRIVFFLFPFMFLSLNTYAVKKSAANITTKHIHDNTKIEETLKPNLLQRLSLKLLTKKLNKKIVKYNKEGTTQKTKLKKGMAIASLVLGILAFLTSFVGIALAILAIIFGAIAQKRAREEPEVYGGKGMATAGLVLGIVALSLAIIVLGFLLYFSGVFFF